MKNPLKSAFEAFNTASRALRDSCAAFIATEELYHQKITKDPILLEREKSIAALQAQINDLKTKMNHGDTSQTFVELQQKLTEANERYRNTFDMLTRTVAESNEKTYVIESLEDSLNALHYMISHPQKKTLLKRLLHTKEPSVILSARGEIVHVQEGALEDCPGRTPSKSLADRICSADKELFDKALSAARTNPYLLGFEMGLGINTGKEYNKIPLLVHKHIVAKIGKDLDGDIAAIHVQIHNEKYDFNKQPGVKSVQIGEELRVKNISEIERRLKAIARSARSGESYLLDFRQSKPSDEEKLAELVPAISQTLSTTTNVTAIGVYPLQILYSSLRSPSQKVDPSKIGLRPLSYSQIQSKEHPQAAVIKV